MKCSRIKWKRLYGKWATSPAFYGTIIARGVETLANYGPRLRPAGVVQQKARGCPREEGFRASLSKDDLIDMQGTVVAVHSGGLYRVQCDAGHEVLAQLSGRMRRFRIKVVPGDRVTVGVSPYDPVRGIITFRAR
jgi:translation initiation factor IF-1